MGISGLVVTKLDGTARGGFVVSIVSDLGVPVKLIGVGEGLNDLRDFEPVLFVDSLLGYTVRTYVGQGRFAGVFFVLFFLVFIVVGFIDTVCGSKYRYST